MSVVIELRTGGPTRSLLQQLPDLRQSVANSGTAMTWRGGQSYYLKAVERLEGMFSHSFLDVTWHERLYSNAYGPYETCRKKLFAHSHSYRPKPVGW
jgi:hypothetical protein